jgi:hypothetical protein
MRGNRQSVVRREVPVQGVRPLAIRSRLRCLRWGIFGFLGGDGALVHLLGSCQRRAVGSSLLFTSCLVLQCFLGGEVVVAADGFEEVACGVDGGVGAVRVGQVESVPGPGDFEVCDRRTRH